MGRQQMPVGTIRKWQGGDVIKAHQNSIFSAGWIPLATSSILENIGQEADSIAARAKSMKLPINGEKFLDHEISNYEIDGEKPYSPSDFKKYEGFYGAGRYSFRNEFSRRYMADKIALAEKTNEALLNSNGNGQSIKLTKDQIESIKHGVKNGFTFNNKFTVNEAKGLLELVKRTYNQLLKGTDFEGEQKQFYDEAIKIANNEFNDYNARIAIKKKIKDNILEKINIVFKDNWGIRESVKTLLDDKYSDWVRKYAKEISRDEAHDQGTLFGVKLDDHVDKFYKALFKKVANDKAKFETVTEQDKIDYLDIHLDTSFRLNVEGDEITFILKKDEEGKFYLRDRDEMEEAPERFYQETSKELFDQILKDVTHVNLEKFLGKEIEYNDPYSSNKIGYIYFSQRNKEYFWIRLAKGYSYNDLLKFEDFTKIEKRIPLSKNTKFSFDETSYRAIINKLNPPDYPFKELVYLRFETLYGKQLDGDWNIDMLPIVYNIEKLLLKLPQGHVLTNKELKTITNSEFGGGKFGYAFYNPNTKWINFTKRATNDFQKWGDLEVSSQFNAVATHEIGHAVSNKLGRHNDLNYKKFVVSCGWSYKQLNIKEESTGGDVRIGREGSNSMHQLLTDYAHQSPEEAFAEYYSIYGNNRERIDKWLETGNIHYLEDKSKLVVAKKNDEDLKPVSSFYKVDNQEYCQQIDHYVKEILKRNPDNNIKLELVNPWHVKYEHDLTIEDIRDGVKETRKEYIRPIIVVKENLNHYKCIFGSKINEGCKYKNPKKFPAAIVITNELYTQLREKYDNYGIQDYLVYKTSNLKVPMQGSEPVFKKGLEYGFDILSVDEIIKNENRLRAMSAIFNSDGLKKALSNLFGLNKIRGIFTSETKIETIDGIQCDVEKARVLNLVNQIADYNKELVELKEIIDN